MALNQEEILAALKNSFSQAGQDVKYAEQVLQKVIGN